MNRYQQRFAELKAAGKKAFVPFTVLGWPDKESCFESIKAMIDSGSSALELGIAFSDPVADGPVIQSAAFATLESGFTVSDAFELLARVRAYDEKIPIGILVYYNVILARGVNRFYADAASAGVDSVLIADLAGENVAEVLSAARGNGIEPVLIVSPLTDEERLRSICQSAGAYIYIVSRLGITGSEANYDDHLQELISKTRQFTKLPLCVGFGVSSPASAAKMFDAGADGVITGSRIIEIIGADRQPGFKQLTGFIQEMVAAGSPGQSIGALNRTQQL